MQDFELDECKDALQHYFASLDGVVLAYLFGSQARGEAWTHSDIDVAVLLEGYPDDAQCFDMRLEIIGGLMELLNSNDVDVLILNQAPPALGYAVLRDGILLYCRDHQARVEYQLHTVNEYLDFEPILKRHVRAILEKARRGELLSGYDSDRRTPRPDPEVLERFARPPTVEL
jgi:predicted nucleotidyltransferase